MRAARRGLVLLAALASLAATCGPSPAEIRRERAIAIARSLVSYVPDTIEAERTSSSGTAVWRVTLRGRLPGQPPPLFETTIVEIDARTGSVVSVARP